MKMETNAEKTKIEEKERKKKRNEVSICVQMSDYNLYGGFSQCACFGADNLSMSTGQCDSSA